MTLQTLMLHNDRDGHRQGQQECKKNEKLCGQNSIAEKYKDKDDDDGDDNNSSANGTHIQVLITNTVEMITVMTSNTRMTTAMNDNEVRAHTHTHTEVVRDAHALYFVPAIFLKVGPHAVLHVEFVDGDVVVAV